LASQEPAPADEGIDSPRLAALAKDLAAGRPTALAKFWEDLRGKAPLVEPVAGDARWSWVTFVWRGTPETRRVSLSGGPFDGQPHQWLTRLAGTDLWYRTERLPNDARFLYSFRVNPPVKVPTDEASQARLWKEHPPRPDPLNPRNDRVSSLAELPDAPAQPWLERVPGLSLPVSIWLERNLPRHGLKQHSLTSERLKQERTFTVYTPPGYDPKGGACGLLVLFDGPGWHHLPSHTPGPVILDNLITDKKLPPLVAVFVDHIERNKELACSEPFADFLATELVPWVRKNYRVRPEPGRVIVGGMSLGGLMAAYCGFRHPEVFGNVLSLSGSYNWYPGIFTLPTPLDAQPGWLTRQFVAAERRPVRFFLTAGLFENYFPLSLLAENRRFRDVLEAKGYAVRYTEFSGGHDPVGWRGPFVEGLMTLAGEPK
jgi:enterochelin esterase family protein